MTDTTDTTVTTETTVIKTPSKKSQAVAIFQAKLSEREQGLYASNKEFRAAVLNTIITDLAVSVASASTMYNQCKKEFEINDLGRDPKKVKVKVEGAKRGRPQGSKNREKVVDAPTIVITTAPEAEIATA